jgi:uncharacterized DUF497 family protein
MDRLIFDWSAANVGHIAEHGVTPEEAEEIVLGDSMEMDFDVVNGEERWSYVGETWTHVSCACCSLCAEYAFAW